MKILLLLVIAVLMAYAIATSIYMVIGLAFALALGWWLLRLFELRDDPLPPSAAQAPGGSEDDYTRRAEEAERRAQAAPDLEVRRAFQDVAAQWLAMAERARRSRY
jgi:hypothetical protein